MHEEKLVWLRSTLTAATAAALLALPAAAVARAAPPPLSADVAPINISSTYGSGDFGRWTVDRWGLPAYDYAIDEQANPIAKQPELSGSVDAWSQIGNDHVVADAFNHGYVQLWSQDRLYQWMNYYDASNRHYAGGYGYLNIGGKVISTLYDDRPAGASTDRLFGVGYYAKRTGVVGSRRRTTRSTRRSATTRCCCTTSRSRTPPPRRARARTSSTGTSTPRCRRSSSSPRLPVARRGIRRSKTLSVAQLPDDVDTQPLTIFASALSAPVSAYDTDTSSFFGSGTRAAPAAVAAGKLSDSIAPPDPNGTEGSAMFAFQSPFALEPGQSVTFRYAYGYAHPDKIAALVARYRAQPHPLEQASAAGRAGSRRSTSGPRTPGSRASCSGTPTRCAPTPPTRRCAGTTSSRRAATTSTSSASRARSGTRSSTCCR